jgi:hypothetical protein
LLIKDLDKLNLVKLDLDKLNLVKLDLDKLNLVKIDYGGLVQFRNLPHLEQRTSENSNVVGIAPVLD